MRALDLRSKSVFLSGPGFYLPERVVPNSELTQILGHEFDDNWIQKRFGVKTRHWAHDGQACSDLALEASLDLFNRFSPTKEGVEALILASVSGDHLSPPTSPILSQKLGMDLIETLDINAACAGFPALIQSASRYVLTGVKQVLAVASEIRSFYLDPHDSKTFPLFGDGAAAVLVSQSERSADFRVLASRSVTQSGLVDLIKIPSGGSARPFARVVEKEGVYISMLDGPKIFVSVVKGLAQLFNEFLQDLQLSEDEIDWLIPHQANIHIIESLAKRLCLTNGEVVSYIDRIGNTSGSSTGIALALSLQEGKFKAKEKLLLLGAGAGGTGAIVLLEKL